MEQQQRFVGVCGYERTHAMQRAPQRESRQGGDGGDGAALTKAECGPQQRQDGEVLELTACAERNSFKEQNLPRQNDRQQDACGLGKAVEIRSRKPLRQPNQQQRGHDQCSEHVA